MTLDELPRNHFAAILADPPWRYQTWDKREAVATRTGTVCSSRVHYRTMPSEEICALPVSQLAAQDCALFLWMSWPMLFDALDIIASWGFVYKTCAFAWTKAHARQIDMFRDDLDDLMGQGYWTRANTEICLLATRGHPQRLNRDVRQAIIEPRRQHSRKPDCIHARIERLVAGPYIELFARQSMRPGWTFFGDQIERFNHGRMRA